MRKEAGVGAAFYRSPVTGRLRGSLQQNVLEIDSVTVSILTVYNRFPRCNLWGNWVKEKYRISLYYCFTTVCESIIISK